MSVKDVPDVAPEACDLIKFRALLKIEERVEAVGGGGGGWSEGCSIVDAANDASMNSFTSDWTGRGREGG